MSIRAFIPPYLLRNLTQAGDPAVAADAARTLRLDSEFRQQRSARVEASVGADVSRDEGTHPSRAIFDAGGERTLPGRLVREEGGSPVGDPAADEAYDGLGATWQLFADVFGRDSLDGRGEPLLGTVHYGQGYDNAFWNGTQMVFGDGDGVIFNRFTIAVEVIGHELSHAVTERTAGLVYEGQSGALNESLSDVFGSLVRQRLLGQSADEADWLIGVGLLATGISGRAIRSMSAPGTAYDDPRLGKDPQPDSMAGYVETTSDSGGVHLNSGIPNRAFYLVAAALGGHAWEAPGQIWYDTIVGPIKPDCDFATFARLTTQAAEARYGATSREVDAVRAAWERVGVTGPAAPAGGSMAPKAPARATGALTVARTGGFAGFRQERTVDLATRPLSDQRAWGSALRDPDLLDPDPTTLSPDAFCYEITCTRPEVDVQLAEQAVPARLKGLIDDMLAED